MLEVVMYFESGEICATAEAASMAEATVEAQAMGAYGHSPTLRVEGTITHRWNGASWVSVH